MLDIGTMKQHLATKGIFMKKLILLALPILAACNADVQSDGFADIKYGMPVEELMRLGFTCEANEFSCDQADPPPAAGKATLFEKPVRLSVQVVDGKVAAIDVKLANYTDDELITFYREAYGDPKVYRITNALAALVERHVWQADSGATIIVNKLLDGGAAPVMPALNGYGTSAIYRSPALSAEMAGK